MDDQGPAVCARGREDDERQIIITVILLALGEPPSFVHDSFSWRRLVGLVQTRAKTSRNARAIDTAYLATWGGNIRTRYA